MIEIISVTKKYGNFTAVDSVTCTARTGRITGLLGVNGAGKTSLLKAAAGIHYCSAGSIKINGYTFEENHQAAQNELGYLSENPSFYQFFTVYEYLLFIAEIRFPQLSKSDRMRSIYETVEKTSLEGAIHKKIQTISKGYRQRLAFAQAVMHKPNVLILDEPTSGLDPIQINEMRSLIRGYAKDRTVLLSTHLMQEVHALCDDICILHEGRLAASGSVSELLERSKAKNLEQAFMILTGVSK